VELVVARIGRPHGIKGEVTVETRTDSPERRFAAGSRLRTDRTSPRELVVASARLNAGTWLLAFEGIEDRNQAESLRGSMLSAEIDLEQESDDETFHVTELIGAKVFHNGEELGIVEEVISLPGQELLALQTGSGEKLIPLVGEFIKEIDRKSKQITVTLPEGMLE